MAALDSGAGVGIAGFADARYLDDIASEPADYDVAAGSGVTGVGICFDRVAILAKGKYFAAQNGVQEDHP